MPFALNCLAPGKYAIAQVDLPDTTPAPSTVRWYGGQEYSWSYIEPDDITLLTIPQSVTWITIDSNNQVVELPTWTEMHRTTFFSRINGKKGYSLSILPVGRVHMQQQLPTLIAFVRIMSLDGKMLGEFTIKGNSTIYLDNKMMNKLLLFEVNNDRRYREKVPVFR